MPSMYYESGTGAVVRNSGDRHTWARRGPASDITVLEGATLADWLISRPKAAAPPPPLPQSTDVGHGEQHPFATAGF